ncbi:MAG: FliI/YscN family ATPase [Candidatus Caenarcaniphilales bacterium]|nr:FliI/YscN family ATPase [Candidatus Caenarcaniphilales bacterium]
MDLNAFKERIEHNILTPCYKGLNALKETRKWHGYISKVVGLLLEAQLPGSIVGEICTIITNEGKQKLAEVVGFRGTIALLLCLEDGKGISQGCKIYPSGNSLQIGLSEDLLGRVIDAIGIPMDHKPPPVYEEFRDIEQPAPDSFGRPRIHDIFSTGVRAIDGLLTLGVGQRVGLFAGSGVGKSTTMGMLARYCSADINIICLVGERGREVQDFLEESLGEEGLKRSVCIIATGDKPAMMRMKCLFTATTVAEYFRDKGKNVLLMVDSMTRTAMAARDVGLAVGEPPTMKGYTPSVFSLIPRVLERAGKSQLGSITAIYAVLVEGDDMNEPVADTVRGVLDGHILLSRKIAVKNHYPAIDVLGSVSRLFTEITDPQHQQAAGSMRNLMSLYKENEDLINIGAYEKGSSDKIDKAIDAQDAINSFLCQGIREATPFQETNQKIKSIML